MQTGRMFDSDEDEAQKGVAGALREAQTSKGQYRPVLK
jgi:hypothetical protein